MNSVQKKFLNQEFLYGISLFCLCSENRDFLHIKISYFCIFFAEIGVLNTNRTPGGASATPGILHFIKAIINGVFLKRIALVSYKKNWHISYMLQRAIISLTFHLLYRNSIVINRLSAILQFDIAGRISIL